MPSRSPSPRPVPMLPVAFHGCVGWLHGGRADTAVVIAGSLGFELLTAHRFLRLLADRLAAGGVAALRFDWVASGDSLG
ncbi:hypothetical protein J8J40_23005, partial [Mycobacterium tuberculosis]|nr:hypothetical protein [Mycobacterium tuberculosis]